MHNLEHGYTLAWYRADAPEDEIATLRQAAGTFGSETYDPSQKFIAAPYSTTDGTFPEGKDVVLARWTADPANPSDQTKQQGVRQSCSRGQRPGHRRLHGPVPGRQLPGAERRVALLLAQSRLGQAAACSCGGRSAGAPPDVGGEVAAADAEGALVGDDEDVAVRGAEHVGARFGLSSAPTPVGDGAVVGPGQRAEVVQPGLTGWPTAVGWEVGRGVVGVEGAAHGRAEREHLGRVPGEQRLPHPQRRLVRVDRADTGGVEHRPDGDRAAGLGQPGAELLEAGGLVVLGPDDPVPLSEGDVGEVEVQHHPRQQIGGA